MNTLPVFDLYDTSGFPLEIIALELKETQLMPDWLDFLTKAVNQNWSPERIMKASRELAEPLGVWYNTEFQDKFKKVFILAVRLAQQNDR